MTFLFTDIEGSSSLWERAPDAMRDALAEHDEILRRITAEHNGIVFKTIGDAFCCAFARPQDAADAAIDAQRSLGAHRWVAEIAELRVRMALHTGSVIERDGDYFGPTVNRVARLMAIGYGGQILVSTATAALLEGTLRHGQNLQNLGPHRLRDLGHAETTYQLEADGLRAEFPALASLDTRPNNLPSQISSFVGRERELDDLRIQLTENRLVTLTGTGGIGKTRLSLQLAASVIDRYRDGAWFVDLTTIADGELVAQTIAAALGLVEPRSEPVLDNVISWLARKNMLLVVDNAEHVLDSVASVVKAILTRCPEIRVVVTSREALHITGEAVYRLETMPAPPAHLRAADLMHHDSTRLLLERARAIVRNLVVTDDDAGQVTALCRKLEGIPLAMELAAARVNTLSLQQLNERLTGPLPLLATRGAARERHGTLRATIDWSYRLLGDEEKRALAALSVFAGGFTLEAFESVVAPESTSAVDVVQSLVDKSFLQLDASAEPPRFRSLDVIREFALAELTASGKSAQVAAAHARYNAEFVACGREITGAPAVRWYVRLDFEMPNVRAALMWCIENDASAAGRLALDLTRYWRVRGNITEARGVLSRLLDATKEQPALRAALLCSASSFAAMQDDFEVSSSYANEALALYRESSDPNGTADALLRIAEVEHRRGRLNRAKEFYERALALYAPAGNARGEMLCTNNLGMLARQEGDYGRARLLMQKALEHAQAAGERRIIGDFIISLAWVNVYLGESASAEALFSQALEQKEAERDRYGVCSAHHGLATVALKEGRLGRARELFRSTIDSARELQLHDYLFRGFDGISAVFALEDDVSKAARYLGLAERLFRESGRQLRDSIAHDVARERIDGTIPASERDALMAEGERLDPYGPI